ncbi:YciI family protein [Nonomuraea candida]|uniref:YciI family protein n=1 Tax=Nonomuraea candida TaxID=359159 RepID=UPI0007C859A2|nr:YciI family protein [Nonomuraea candida]
MQYALLIYAEPGYLEGLPAAEREAVQAEYAVLAEDDRCVGAAQLRPAETATCVRMAGGRTLLTDGPFADTKEVLGGFCLIEAADLDEALELAERIPAVRLGGTVEVRPLAPGPGQAGLRNAERGSAGRGETGAGKARRGEDRRGEDQRGEDGHGEDGHGAVGRL